MPKKKPDMEALIEQLDLDHTVEFSQWYLAHLKKSTSSQNRSVPVLSELELRTRLGL